jgi:hypothetical protein
LYNRALRSLPGGAVREETFDGRLALGTELYPTTRPLVQNDPWMYFDVDDSWLYFARGRVPVTVTIEAHACSTGPQRIGFNIHYDSIDGYRATKWQWVEAGAMSPSASLGASGLPHHRVAEQRRSEHEPASQSQVQGAIPQ